MERKLHWITYCLYVVVFYSTAQNRTGALLDRSGNIMRGTAIAVSKFYQDIPKYKNSDFAKNRDTWIRIKGLNLNTVRLAWVDPWFEDRESVFWTAQEFLPELDEIVARAEETGMNIVINYHNVGEQERIKKRQNSDEYLEPRGFDRVKEFWELVAPRYKDKDFVYYELTNEPVFNDSKYIEANFKNNLLELYNRVRELAPYREILLFSFNGINYDIERVVEDYDSEIDWNYTTIAYHLYGRTTTDSKNTQRLAEKYRVMCTEFFLNKEPGYVPDSVDGFFYASQALEANGHSWLDWSDWNDNSLAYVKDTLLVDAVNKGYIWQSAKSRQNYPVGATYSSTDRIEAEHYDYGGKNVSYFDTTTGSQLDPFRFDDVDVVNGVDTDETRAVYLNGNNEWLEYTISNEEAATYTTRFRVSTSSSNQKLRIYVNGVSQSEFDVPATGGPDTFTDVDVPNIMIPEGSNVIRIESVGNDIRFNWMEFNLTQLSTNEFTKAKELFRIYPVPAADILQFTTSSAVSVDQVRIVDLAGQEVLVSSAINNKQIDVSGLASGMYIVGFKTSDQFYQLPFVKK